MNQISLLFPGEEKHTFSFSSTAAGDLGIPVLAEHLSDSRPEQEAIRKILTEMPTDAETVQYRNAIYKELRGDEQLHRNLYEVCDSLRFYFNDRPVGIGGTSTIWELLQRLRSLEHYIRSVIRLRDLIADRKFTSAGMQRFADYVHSLSDHSGFDELLEDISFLKEGSSKIRSLTIGVNLNQEFYPAEAGIISINQYRFDQQSALKRFLAFHRKDQITEDRALAPFSMEVHEDNWDWVDTHIFGIPESKLASNNALKNNLTAIIERMLPSMTAKLHKVLEKYVHVSGRGLADLADEMLFYLRFIELERKLTEKGMPCCIGAHSDGDTRLSQLYNLRLAVLFMKEKPSEPIVCNDISFTKEQTVQILTGPNRGGKTILTQAIGLAFLLHQSGVFVPAASADIRLCDGIYTHFPVEEERTVSLGRLGEEADRFHEICSRATGQSLLLFNESFASTSHTESLYIAEDVLKYLCCLGARTCFNTHMHELAEHCSQFSESAQAICGAVSLVMENEFGNRYKVSVRKPDGKSYARVIAQQYGITFEQLSKMLPEQE